jgi:hypothetical protein
MTDISSPITQQGPEFRALRIVCNAEFQSAVYSLNLKSSNTNCLALPLVMK